MATHGWLHLSDLHLGMGSQKVLWPNVKHQFFDDIKRILSRTGQVGTVIFSGDVVQRGSKDEYGRATEELCELWEILASLGSTPSLIVTPGNHDLCRPEPDDPTTIVLCQWSEQKELQSSLFSGKANSAYRRLIDDAFKNYEDWSSTLATAGIPVVPSRRGFFPGDQIITIEDQDLRIGVLCLNSTWLHLVAGDLRERLSIDVAQIAALTDDLEKWSRNHDFNIVVTHHPTEWLHPRAQAFWRSEVDPAGRFDLHLFGHMHEPTSTSTSLGGGHSRNLYQSPSLFGLESLGDGSVDRTHGYTVARLIGRDRERRVNLWPRKLVQSQDMRRHMAPDYSFALDGDESITIRLRDRTSASGQVPATSDGTQVASFTAVEAAGDMAGVLKNARYHLPPAKAHLQVRRVEQTQCVSALRASRCIWVTAEWGLGGDEFLYSVLSRYSEDDTPCYRLDLSNFVSRDSLVESFREVLGCSFEQFCDHLAAVPTAALLLDDVPVGSLRPAGQLSLELELEDVAKTVLEYCPSLVVFLRSRRVPQGVASHSTALRPLDEADLQTYIANHEQGRKDLLVADQVRLLHRHTEGVPSRIDATLKELAVASLGEIVSSDLDEGAIRETVDDAPVALRRAIAELAEASERGTRRSFALLQALSVFPHGIELEAIRRFNGPHAFHPRNALDLLDRSLIVASEKQSISTSETDEGAKVLVVHRPVRDYVRSLADDDTLNSLNRRAADLFFGPLWASGSTSWPASHNYSSPKCSSGDIANASALVGRLLKSARSRGDVSELEGVLSLAASYANALLAGDHFQSAAAFCEDTLPLLVDGDNPDRTHAVKFAYAEALRMCGQISKAKEILEEIRHYPFSNDTKQDLLVTLALCEDKLKNSDAAVDAAQEAVKLNRHSSLGLQARSLILENSKDDPNKGAKLIEVERLARKRGANTVANNLALERARVDDDWESFEKTIGEIVASRDGHTDHYNSVRAVVLRAERVSARGGSIGEIELMQLIGCYQFLFNERMPGLFNRTHDLLWAAFRENKQIGNLLALFRHSSLKWRLHGDIGREARSAANLREVVGDALGLNDRNATYYLLRVEVVILPADG